MGARQNNTLSAFNLKSSVLCPETRHINSQYLALQQLNAHYTMVSRAKGSVDMTAPKSLQSYLSNANQRTKNNWQEYHLMPPESPKNRQYRIHVTGSRALNENYASDHFMAGCNENASTSIHKSIQTGISYPHFETKVGDKISWYLEAVSQGELRHMTKEAYSLQHASRLSNSTVSLPSKLRSKKVVKGDLMDTHKSCFTSSQRPFSPRILAKNNTKSKVLGMKCYTPPRRKKQQNSVNSSDTFESYEDDIGDEQEESEQVNDEEEEEEEDIEEIKTEESTPDDIEEEVDVEIRGSSHHQDWLREQALRAQIQQKLRINRTKPPLNLAQKIRDNLATRNNLPPTEKEEKHLKFLSEVTEDILRSGIFTDRAIQGTFDFHLQFCSSEEEREKMKGLLDQVFEGLQASAEDCSNIIKRITLSPSNGIPPYKASKSVQENSDHALNATAAPNFEDQSSFHALNNTNQLSAKDANAEENNHVS